MNLRLSAIALLLAGSALAAAPGTFPDVPTPYLPSTEIAVDEMLRLAGTGPDDLVVDLGSGDGRVVIAAARDYGARGLGIEIDPKLVAESEANARRAGVAERVAFRQGDVLAADYREATVVTLYLLPGLVDKLKPRLLAELRAGTRIVAHDYGFSDWKPDRSVVISKTYHLYLVPAAIAGKWRLHATLPEGEREFEFELEQRYQEIRGGARVAGGYLPAFEARLAGDRIAFVLVESGTSHRFEGRVQGTLLMEGTVRSGPGRTQAAGSWRATRVVRGGDEG
ncbi:MAG TPA: class I SAM-dependent methyltransferase [Burkholderiales bacterium]|nr:class I SAM-dependent methyltransferase [Burkholderiales bacterium]